MSDSHHEWKHADLERRMCALEVQLGLRPPPDEKPPEVAPATEAEIAAAQAVLHRAGFGIQGK